MLLGRDSETRAIDEALASARVGKSARLVIRGEPGIGKTALLDHAVAEAGSMRVLSARGVEFETGMPFAGLHELLLPALGVIDRLSPIHAAALRSSLGLGERIEADRLIVGAAVLDLISAYADQVPVLLIVDDAQWLDRASAEAIAFAVRRLLADPVAVLLAIRGGEDSPLLGVGLPEINLEGLDPQAASQLLRASAAVELPADYVNWLIGATGGNPLALRELARVDPDQSSRHDLPVATSVERVYLRRADGLSAGAKQALLVMAASGFAEPGLVRRAAAAMSISTNDLEAAEGAEELVRAGAERLEFVHPLARAAVYHSASPAQRRAANRALAAAMTDPADADRRAWHLAAAASGWDAEAAEALEQSAIRSRESSGYDAAAAALSESARLTEGLELRASRLFRAAENAWLAGRGGRAVDLLESTRGLTRSKSLLVDIDNLDGHIAMRRGAVDKGFRMLTDAARTIEESDRLKAVRMLSDAVLSTFGAGKPAAFMVAARHALDLLRPDDPAEPAALAHVAYGTLAILAGRGAEGAQSLRESVALFDSVPATTVDPLVLQCEALAGLFLREAKAGRELIDRALIQARDHAPTAALPSTLFMLGRNAAATDRWALARARYEDGVRVARETTQYTWLAGVVAGLAWLDALEGREEDCRAHATEARALAEQYGMDLFASWAMIALGQLDLGYSRAEGALQHFVECVELLRHMEVDDPDLSPSPDMVDALVRLGRSGEAEKIAEDYTRSAETKGQPFSLARAARARALLAPDGSYVIEFETALRHHDATPDIFERARTQLYYGERLRRLRRRVDARKHLRDALKAFDHLGAAPWSERALSELQASGETARVRDDRYRRQLTPQELQVAITLAEGATTREAAARLYLSPKTVEYHLRHVYDKLEVRTREELRAAVIDRSAATP